MGPPRQRRHVATGAHGPHGSRFRRDDPALRVARVADHSSRLRSGHDKGARSPTTLRRRHRTGTTTDRVEWLRSEMLKTRVAHGYCSRELVADAAPTPTFANNPTTTSLPPSFNPSSKPNSPTSTPSATTPKHVVELRSRPPRTRRRQHRRPPPTAQKSSLINGLRLTRPRGPVNRALVRELTNKWLRPGHPSLNQGAGGSHKGVDRQLERGPQTIRLAQER